MGLEYFGTDGIRGRVGSDAVMAPDFVLKLGWSVGHVLCKGEKNLALIGKDTRISGYMFESALEAGLSSAGVHVRLLGPMPTPAIAYLTRTLRAAVGIVISASHNPYHDNGVKFFSADGKKLSKKVEHEIELQLKQPLKVVSSDCLGKVKRVNDAAGRYIEFCKSTVPTHTRLNDLKIVVDCAHGSTYHIAPKVFSELGVETISIADKPNGLNINDKSGAASPELLQEAVIEHRADLGIAIDGDGDRLIMVDDEGVVVDGDEILYIIARALKLQHLLGGGVVGTLMSNLGLERALQSHGIEFKRAAVGDRHVMEVLRANSWKLGGEPSGHIVYLGRTTTGDAIIAALQVLQILIHSDKKLCEIKSGMEKYPQTHINVSVPISLKNNISRVLGVQQAVKDAESCLQNCGRVLIRPSGTEPLVRVMVEGFDASVVQGWAKEIADSISDSCRREALG